MKAALSKLPFNLRWALALLVAGVSSVGGRAGWKRIGKALGLFVGIIQDGGKRVPEDMELLRLQTCGKCPLFHVELSTCGSPLKKATRGVGCYCFMPEKAKYESSRCWIDSDTEPGQHRAFGWDAAIRANIPDKRFPRGCSTGRCRKPGSQ